jgi:hypothetical protein
VLEGLVEAGSERLHLRRQRLDAGLRFAAGFLKGADLAEGRLQLLETL